MSRLMLNTSFWSLCHPLDKIHCAWDNFKVFLKDLPKERFLGGSLAVPNLSVYVQAICAGKYKVYRKAVLVRTDGFDTVVLFGLTYACDSYGYWFDYLRFTENNTTEFDCEDYFTYGVYARIMQFSEVTDEDVQELRARLSIPLEVIE